MKTGIGFLLDGVELDEEAPLGWEFFPLDGSENN
jgi:hypothetical protein